MYHLFFKSFFICFHIIVFRISQNNIKRQSISSNQLKGFFPAYEISHFFDMFKTFQSFFKNFFKLLMFFLKFCNYIFFVILKSWKNIYVIFNYKFNNIYKIKIKNFIFS